MVKSISAVLEQGAIAVGGKTRIVVTALDAGDNPVADQQVSVKHPGGTTGPEKLSILVDNNDMVNKNVAGSANTLTGNRSSVLCRPRWHFRRRDNQCRRRRVPP